MSVNEIGRLSASGSGFSSDSYLTKSIDDQIDKLKAKKRKIEQDLKKSSTNPDPLAARGENNANRQVNKRILDQIEKQLQVLESRKRSEEASNTVKTSSVETAYLPKDLGRYLAIRV